MQKTGWGKHHTERRMKGGGNSRETVGCQGEKERDLVNEPHINWNCVTSNNTLRNVAKFSDTVN
jgi:hypothetical protein